MAGQSRAAAECSASRQLSVERLTLPLHGFTHRLTTMDDRGSHEALQLGVRFPCGHWIVPDSGSSADCVVATA
jgi:hypothetical protein